MQQLNISKFDQVFAQLPPRRKEVLLRLLKGDEDTEIAESLDIAPGTVRTQISYICKKFELNDNGERRSRRAALFALFAKHKPELLGNKVLASNISKYNQSQIYVERPPIESLCQEEIKKPGTLLRIKAPPKMGKTELMSRLINYAKNQNYRAVDLKLRLTESTDFESLDSFLRWFCNIIAQAIGIPNEVEKYWQQELGNSKLKCMGYFENYILSFDRPLVIGLDDLDRIFPYPEITNGFLSLLRSWHENAKTKSIWKQLRLILIHTQEYTQNNLHQSPFNVGIDIELPEFDREQVQQLVAIQGLEWSPYLIEDMMAIIGGHPYLIQMSIDKVKQIGISIDELLENSAKESGAFGEYLRQNLQYINNHNNLKAGLRKVVTSNQPVDLNSNLAWPLLTLGLIKYEGSKFVPFCQLYRRYFSKNLEGKKI